jgi:hypothetical protein
MTGDLKITADMIDTWGKSKFTAQAVGRNFKGTKIY